jgi:GrpB-like predicted nucleotidyltransferase (UPF0157 family)
VEFSPHWKESFMKEREDLERSLGHLALEIHHIGSTAVPGLAAKPVIDIMVATRSIFEVGRFKDKILSLGYLHVPQSDTDRLFFRKGMPRTHHLHIVKLGTWAYYSHLWCRDYLTDHASTAEEYECLKTVLSKHHGSDREAYEQGKEDMIAMILERAVKERMIGLKGCV